ncbi:MULTISPECIES: DUF3667 domain-containing protein [unclassified Duganella]|uniref:DUF3667 domain-containing protein n=1 Tax=unclassified Duganella TaxID=2636909 RepID=UPI0006FD5EB6|nr:MULTISPECIES: DUF3667 domain-containing protein [unclassified Duganella]KQV54300.1 hypothetical protein ASD07_07160 [Duganella sp. Root336D2]KRC03426.1 hypothetical protein ASE26_00885 [Duganella sp. Root198D2]
MEIEVAGDLVTASLVAKEVEGDAGKPGEHAHGASCANCGTPVPANYCGSCGQKGHLHKSVLHLGEELVHGLLHFDTKGWRTLPLLVARPGQLTRRYIDGQRTRFVSPLALFLFMMFFMFFVFSLTMGTSSGPSTGKVTDSKNGKAAFEQTMNEKIAEQKKAIAEAESDLKDAEPGTSEVPKAQHRLDEAKKALDGLNIALASGKIAMTGTAKFTETIKPAPKAAGKETAKEASREAVTPAESAKTKEPGIIQEILHDVTEGLTDQDMAGSKEAKHSEVGWISKGIQHAVSNPELAQYKLKNAAYKYSFLLVPISMPFLWLMFFWRRGVAMYDHAVFSLYSLSFMSLLFTIVATLSYFDYGGLAAFLFVFIPPVHMFLQLRGTYSLSRYGALWRTCFLLFMTIIVLTTYALAVLALSAT